MFPDLSYIFHHLFGTAPDNWTSIFKTFGLFLGLAFFASAYVLWLEFKRKEEEGIFKPTMTRVALNGGPSNTDILINVLIGFILGFKIPYIATHFDAFKTDGAGIVFSGKGNWLTGLLALAAFGVYYYWKRQKVDTKNIKWADKAIYPRHRVGDITIVAAIFGILGSRLFSIFENVEAFLQDPLGQIFSGSGLTIYGGLILAFAAVFYYVRRLGIAPIHVMDAVAPALIIGYAVGRLGCQFSGDGDWGIVNTLVKPGWFILPDWLWSYDYPHNVLNEGIPIENCDFLYCRKLSPGVFPTPIYETVLGLIIFAILWLLRKRIKVAGALFFVYLLLNGIERFFIEQIRVNEKYDFLNLGWSLSQFIAFAFIAIGAGALVLLYRKNKSPAN